MTPKRLTLETMQEALAMSREHLFSQVDRQMGELRIDLLDSLANAVDVHYSGLTKVLAHFEPESDVVITNAQRDLRTIWDSSTPLSAKQKMVDAWMDAATKRIGRVGIHAWLGRGRLEFDLFSFPGQFVLAILENWWKFQVCSNPECPGRYFLAKRKTQRYCERGECTRYAQRLHALNWWNKKGKALRRKGDSK